ncbi:gastrula zinc finger protein XlCGF57.1-like isoform X1 [Schistocerca americana]|uniref:gastrula zinc finger protein XlCGF57.1-like isoform X1 n=2 Tax=Schistocerca americana TaxID=7009 RepID=UPI001F4F5B07|nr:gastrula zinc finger protein XlCGF57.1-like isoform X1 [Schistocerca americana]XP_046982372.1 gastrula zinc finger protein XlCGF57.1-like isoform X1 [Schistocerca americana]
MERTETEFHEKEATGMNENGIQIKKEEEYSEFLALFSSSCEQEHVPPNCIYIKEEDLVTEELVVKDPEDEEVDVENIDDHLQDGDMKDVQEFPHNVMEPLVQVETQECKQEWDAEEVVESCDTAVGVASCPECGLQLPDGASLSRHVLSHQLQRRLTCALCGQLCSSSVMLMRHLHSAHAVDMPAAGVPPSSASPEDTMAPVRRTKRPYVRRAVPAVTARVRSSGEKQEYQCSQCNKMFHSHYRLETHERMHKEGGLFPCMYCPKCFTRENALKTHLLKHNGEKPFVCTQCGNRFRNKHNLTVHIRLHTGELPHECKICGKRFRIKCSLTVHMLEHAGETPYKCAVCNKGFKTKRCAKVHMRSTHTGERPFVCHLCGKRFAWCGELNKHIKIQHTGVIPPRPYRCRKCFTKFRFKPDYDKHVASCTDLAVPQGALRYECHECGEKFHRRIALRYHLEDAHGATSKAIGQFECEPCGRRFLRKTTLRIHIRRHLEPNAEAENECPYCKLQLHSRGSLERHVRTHTGERPFACPQCNKKFGRNGDLAKHLRTHVDVPTETCDQCGKTFRWRSALYRHIRGMHTVERPHECSLCGSCFAWGNELRKHMRLHTGGNPYPCHLCPRQFPTKRILTNHLLEHTGEVPDD